MLSTFNLQELMSAFIVLFAVIDIIGSIPIILNLKQSGRDVNAVQATLISFALLIGFFYAGDMVLKLFQVDIASFAVAGSIVCVYMYRAFGTVVSMIASSAVILLIRYLAAKYHWNLPHIDFKEK